MSNSSLIGDNIDRKSLSKIGTKSFSHLEDQIDKNKSRTEASSYQHVVGDDLSDINIIYGRLSFIRHTSDVSDFRIFEKLSSNTNVNHIDYTEDIVNDVVDDYVELYNIQHITDYNNSDELNSNIQFADISLILGDIDSNNIKMSLSSIYQSPSNIDYALVKNAIHDISHNSNNTDHISTNTSISSICIVENIDNIDNISNTVGVSDIYNIYNNTDSSSSSESIDSVYTTKQLDVLGNIIDIVGVSHNYQSDKMNNSTDISSVIFSRYDIGESTFELGVKNIDAVFGDNHDIGIVIGVGDNNSTTYVATPVMFDMSILGINQSNDTPQHIPINMELSSINIGYNQFKIGTEVIMSGVDYTMYHNGSIGCISNVSNINHSNNTHKTTSRVGLYLLSHIRDICYFDNTDTFTWDNDNKTWDNDPERV